jgi:hypothetical protein
MKALVVHFILATIFLTACKEPYEPEVGTTTSNLLVVEGYINTGEDVTTIKLTRTVDLKNKQIKVEPNATLKVEGENGHVVQGTSNNKGICTLETSNIDKTQKYRVRIITKNGKEYVTDFLENLKTPEIQNIDFKLEEEGARIHPSTQGNDDIRYYGWEFEETWEFSSRYYSYFEYKNGQVIPRDPSINITLC